jgi:hypothetical protein
MIETRVLDLLNQLPSTTTATPETHDSSVKPKQTENIASSRTPIPSPDMRSLSRDTHHVSPIRDLTSTTVTSSASQQSDSTAENALYQPTAQDILDQKELNLVQGNSGHTPPTKNIASNLAPIPLPDTHDSLRETHNSSPTRVLKTIDQDSLDQQRDETVLGDMPSPTTLSPKWATTTSCLKQNTNGPSDLNSCPQTPQSATSDKCLITINFLESMVDQYRQSKR